jgi:type II secretory pathway pseudopilin PulG
LEWVEWGIMLVCGWVVSGIFYALAGPTLAANKKAADEKAAEERTRLIIRPPTEE